MNGKTIGNLTLVTAICIVVFWVFMALQPVQAQSCGSSWQICRYRAQVRAAWRVQHPGVEYPWVTRGKSMVRVNRALMQAGLPPAYYP
jgi:hypothetical protein